MKSNDAASSDFINSSIILFPQHTDFKLEVTLLGTPLQLVTNDCLHTVLNCVNSLLYDINVMLCILSEYFTAVIYAL